MLSEKEKKALKQQIRSNQYEVFVLSVEEMDAVVRSSSKGKLLHIQNTWGKLKGKAEVGASYYASAEDLRTLSKLVGDLGGFTTKAYIKTYGGKPHIIIKGHPGLRKLLTGTKYGTKNPKVITMGLGKSGAIHAAKSGGIFSVVILSAYRVTDYFLTDEATLSQLIGSLATDVVKVGIATAASIGVASVLVGVGVTLAIGPIVAVFITGVAVSMALGAIDEHYGITDRVVEGLDELGYDFKLHASRVKQNLQRTTDKAVASIIDYVIDLSKPIIIDVVQHHVNKFLLKKPRVY